MASEEIEYPFTPAFFRPGSEREALESHLDVQRVGMLRKIDGVDDAAARTAPTASSLTLLGLVKHLAMCERTWFQAGLAGRVFPGEWPEAQDREEGFTVCETDTVEYWVAYYREQIEQSRAVSASMELDDLAKSDQLDCNLRHVLVHMISETARHAGHADIIRETLDGTRGM